MPNTSIALYLDDEHYVKYAQNAERKKIINSEVRNVVKQILSETTEEDLQKLVDGRAKLDLTGIKIVDVE